MLLAHFVLLFPPSLSACAREKLAAQQPESDKERSKVQKTLLVGGGLLHHHHGPHLPRAHRRPPPLLVRPVRHLPDQPQRAHLHAVHGGDGKGIPLQQGREPQLQVSGAGVTAGGEQGRTRRRARLCLPNCLDSWLAKC